MNMETTYEVQPRYTSGMPGRTVRDTASRIALEEAKNHFFEVGQSHRARALGLGGIVLAITETSDHYDVMDMITGQVWVWPYRGECEFCHRKGVHTVRGFLQMHEGCKAAPFVGTLVKG